MARHARQRVPRTLLIGAIALAVALAGALVTVALVRRDRAVDRLAQTQCGVTLGVVTASSYLPVLDAVAGGLATGPQCVRLDVRPIDGRPAAASIPEIHADLWIPDDPGWSRTAAAAAANLAKPIPGGAGTVLATSPIYLVSDAGTASKVTGQGGGWRGLAGLAASGGVHLALSDPAGSGDGLLAAGALGEAVWNDGGMDASAEALSAAVRVTRTVRTGDPVLPPRPGEVALVAERTLVPVLSTVRRDNLTITAPADRTAALRYTFLPTAAAVADPALGGGLDRLLRALSGAQADRGLAAAGLRRPGKGPPEGAPAGLPPVSAPLFDVLAAHHNDHDFATWHAADRRGDVLIAVDVSGSMADPAPATGRPLINLVGDSIGELAELLPDDGRLGLWEFGSKLDANTDYRVLVSPDDLDQRHRAAIAAAVAQLRARPTGTGLHDTILAAYLAARDGARPGVPSHALVFTDGRNEDDEPSLTLPQLTEQLAHAADPGRPVRLTVITFGAAPDVAALAAGLQPVRGFVDPVSTAGQVRAAFLHAAAGGLPE
ncbi:MAG: VWA domain-containing protein [Labedaea sp.]